MKWLFAVLLVLQAHFAASYLVPLDREAQATFGGLLRWLGPGRSAMAGSWAESLPLANTRSGVGEAHPPPSRLTLARPCSQNVFHPVSIRSVREGDDVPIVSAIGVDGSAICVAGFSTDVVHDRKSWQVAGHS